MSITTGQEFRLATESSWSSKNTDYGFGRFGGMIYTTTLFGAYGQFNSGLGALYVPASDGSFVPPPDQIESLKLRSLRSMLPGIKSELSALNSLYELKDIVSLKRSAQLILSSVKRLLGRYGMRYASASFNACKRMSTKGLVTKTVADGYLQWMFNLRPLISDITGIYQAVATHERRINDLVNRSGKLQTCRFSCDLKEELLGSDTGWSANYNLPEVRSDPNSPFGVAAPRMSVAHRRKVVPEVAKFHATMQYNFTFSAFQVEHARLLGFLDMLGINLNPAIIWNALPWSFIVDWVFGIGRFLDSMKISNMEPKINVLQYCWSVKRSRKIYVTSRICSKIYNSDWGDEMSPLVHYTHPVVCETAYRREAGLPSVSSFTTSGLSLTELSLGAALLITRRRSRKRR